MRGKGKLSTTVFELSYRQSIHILKPPSFFLANKIGALYGDEKGAMRPLARYFSIYSLSSASSAASSGYSFLRGGSLSGSLSGMRNA